MVGGGAGFILVLVGLKILFSTKAIIYRPTILYNYMAFVEHSLL